MSSASVVESRVAAGGRALAFYRVGESERAVMGRRTGALSPALDRVLAVVPLTPPWTVAEFLRWLGEYTEKSVLLSPWPMDSVVSGDECRGGSVWVTNDRLVIKYDASRSRRNQLQQVFHEAAHVLCDHRGDGKYVVSPSVLTDGIDPDTIR